MLTMLASSDSPPVPGRPKEVDVQLRGKFLLVILVISLSISYLATHLVLSYLWLSSVATFGPELTVSAKSLQSK